MSKSADKVLSKSFQFTLTPKEIVKELDKHIVGQAAAKRSVAIALRNRFRRMQVDTSLRQEITPKNILLIGPTGVGKTEIARRLAKLANAPFIKVEATKFTEVGYVGRDVDSIIRDLVDVSVKLTREEAIEKVKDRAEKQAEDKILDALSSSSSKGKPEVIDATGVLHEGGSAEFTSIRQSLRKDFRAGKLNDKEIELDMSGSNVGVEIMAPPGMEEMTNQLQNIFQNLSSDRVRRRKLRVKDAYKLLKEEEAAKLINDEDVKARALERAEQSGIVFLDEIDKITQRSEHRGGGEVSREGVQRDLLPLVEGCTVSTKYGMVKTDHVLFIASGAFHLSKPSDLIPELQGRLPIRVELDALTSEDFVRILTEPDACLTVQYQALLDTEGVNLKFSKDGIQRIADIAFEMNERTENIGARRLYTVMERLLDDISFNASEQSGSTKTIDKKYVNSQLNALLKDEDLSQFIL